MSQTITEEPSPARGFSSTPAGLPRRGPRSVKIRVADVLGKIIFVSLLALFIVTAIPYGTAEAWWKAFFVCVVFALTILWLIDGFLSESWLKDGWAFVLPVLALAVFSILQTLQFGQSGKRAGAITQPTWDAISVDPYQTRFFTLQLLAIMLSGVLLFRYVSSQRRLRIVIDLVIGLAVASAIFGILRQTAQHSLGFGLPLLAPGQGYGQFINKNHFAYLMEMALGLILGLLLGGGIKRERVLIYVAALLPIWTALGLCGSRGGLVAMMAQVITAALLASMIVRTGHSNQSQTRLARIARSLPMRLILLLVLIFGVVLGTLWLGGDRLATRIEESRVQLNSDEAESRMGVSRNEIWRVTWKMFVANPIVGVGMGAYWAAVPAFHDASGAMTPQEADNEYLELLATGGVVGLAFGIWFAVVVFRRTRKNLRSPNRFRRAACLGATIGITGVAVHSLLDFGLHMMVNALVLTTLVVIATSNYQWANRTSRRG
jgi:O-antigen ligase